MKNEDFVSTVVLIVGVVILAPIVIGSVITLGSYTYAGIANTINKVKFNKQMKKGLKEGKLIKIDGQYYEVSSVEEA